MTFRNGAYVEYYEEKAKVELLRLMLSSQGLGPVLDAIDQIVDRVNYHDDVLDAVVSCLKHGIKR